MIHRTPGESILCAKYVIIYIVMHVQIEQEDDQGAVTSCPPAMFTAAKLSSGEILSTFWLQALDKWGNSTGPSPDLPFNLVVACDALQSSPITAAFNEVGIAQVNGEQLRSIQPFLCLPGSKGLSE